MNFLGLKEASSMRRTFLERLDPSQSMEHPSSAPARESGADYLLACGDAARSRQMG